MDENRRQCKAGSNKLEIAKALWAAGDRIPHAMLGCDILEAHSVEANSRAIVSAASVITVKLQESEAYFPGFTEMFLTRSWEPSIKAPKPVPRAARPVMSQFHFSAASILVPWRAVGLGTP